MPLSKNKTNSTSKSYRKKKILTKKSKKSKHLLGIHDRLYDIEDEPVSLSLLPSVTILDTVDQCRELLDHSYFDIGKHNPDYVYVSIGGGINRIEAYSIYEIIPSFLHPEYLPKEANQTCHTLCILLDNSNHIDYINQQITWYNQQCNPIGYFLHLVIVKNNCNDTDDLTKNEKLLREWTSCVQHTIGSIISYLDSIRISPRKCVFANFVRFKVDTYGINNFLPTIITLCLGEKYIHRLFIWCSYRYPDLLYKFTYMKEDKSFAKIVEETPLNDKSFNFIGEHVLDLIDHNPSQLSKRRNGYSGFVNFTDKYKHVALLEKFFLPNNLIF